MKVLVVVAALAVVTAGCAQAGNQPLDLATAYCRAAGVSAANPRSDACIANRRESAQLGARQRADSFCRWLGSGNLDSEKLEDCRYEATYLEQRLATHIEMNAATKAASHDAALYGIINSYEVDQLRSEMLLRRR